MNYRLNIYLYARHSLEVRQGGNGAICGVGNIALYHMAYIAL